MELSIVIISFNTKDLTLTAIESIYNEGSDIEREIIVVDNDSKDGTVPELRKLVARDKNFRLIENNKNLGFAKANNQGLSISKGKYALLLNSDTLVKKGALGKLLDFARKKEDAGVVGPRLLNRDGSVQKSCYRFPTLIGAIKEYWFGFKGNFVQYAPKGERPVEVDALAAAAFLLTPKALKRVGVLDEKYYFYFEDLDYCKRVKETGLKVYYFPKAEIVHLLGASGKAIASEENQWKRLIPGSKIYHGLVKHSLIAFVMWTAQKWEKILKRN
jgi:GT2 family glycosyltransferase